MRIGYLLTFEIKHLGAVNAGEYQHPSLIVFISFILTVNFHSLVEEPGHGGITVDHALQLRVFDPSINIQDVVLHLDEKH